MFPCHEASMSIVVMRDDVAQSGAMAGSRMEGSSEHERPARSIGLVSSGDSGKVLPDPGVRAEVGSRTGR